MSNRVYHDYLCSHDKHEQQKKIRKNLFIHVPNKYIR